MTETVSGIVEDRVRKVIREHLCVPDKEIITPNSVLGNDLGADSLDVAELGFAFEAEFGVEMPDLKEEDTVKAIVGIVNEELKKK